MIGRNTYDQLGENNKVAFVTTLLLFAVGLQIFAQKPNLVVPVGHTLDVTFSEISTDHKLLVSISSDRSIKIWQVEKAQLLRSIEQNNEVHFAKFDRSGDFLLTSDESSIKLWNVNSGALIKEYGEIGDNYASFDATATKILTKEKLIDLQSGLLIKQFRQSKEVINRSNFNSNSTLLVTACDDRIARIWNVKTNILQKTLIGHSDNIYNASFSSDNQRVVTASADSTAKIWNIANGKEILTLRGHKNRVTSATFSANNKMILTSSLDNTAKLWDASSGKLLFTFPKHNGWKGEGTISPDNTIIVVPSFGQINFWDGVTGELIKSFVGEKPNYLLSAFFNRKLDKIILGFYKEIRILNLLTGSLYDQLVGVVPNKVILHNDKEFEFTFDDKSSVSLLDQNNRLIHTFNHNARLPKSTISQNKTYVATYSNWDRVTKLWDRKSGNLIKQFDNHKFLGFNSGESGMLLSVRDTMKFFDLVTGSFISSKPIMNFQKVDEVFYSPDSKLLLFSSETVALSKLWNSQDGGTKDLLVDGDIKAVDWQRMQVLVSKNFKSTLLSLDTGEELLSFYAPDSANLIVTHPSGLFDASPGAMDKLYFVQGLDIIDFAQLKDRYYEPGLWKKVMSGEKLRDVSMFSTIDLPPDIMTAGNYEGGKASLTFQNREGGIGQITVLVNGLEAVEDLRPAGFNTKQPEWKCTLDLIKLPNLKKGEENLIEVRAWNEGHWVISRPFQIRFTPPATKGAEAVVEETKKDKPQPNIHILSVGVADYEGAAIDLKYSAKDAESMALALQLGAQKLFGIEKSFVYTLTDNSKEKPNKATIKKTFAEIAKKSSPNDVFIVYLSGHGINWGGDNGDFYYLTRDAYSTDLQAYNDPAIRDNVALSSKELTELFKTVPSDKRVLMIDACASGKMVENLMTSRDISSSTLRALDRMRDRTGFHIITGCAADAVSYEASRFGQGVLTYSLIEGIKGASLRENKFVDINQLFQHARERVPVLAKGIGGIQSPQVFSPSGSQSFDIGELDEVTKAKIPLPKTRPVFIRSQLQDETKFRDVLGISKKLDEALNETSAKGENAPLLFVDVAEFPEGCQISGLYNQTGGKIIARLNKLCDGKETTISIEANTVEELVNKIVAQL